MLMLQILTVEALPFEIIERLNLTLITPSDGLLEWPGTVESLYGTLHQLGCPTATIRRIA